MARPYLLREAEHHHNDLGDIQTKIENGEIGSTTLDIVDHDIVVGANGQKEIVIPIKDFKKEDCPFELFINSVNICQSEYDVLGDRLVMKDSRAFNISDRVCIKEYKGNIVRSEIIMPPQPNHKKIMVPSDTNIQYQWNDPVVKKSSTSTEYILLLGTVIPKYNGRVRIKGKLIKDYTSTSYKYVTKLGVVDMREFIAANGGTNSTNTNHNELALYDSMPTIPGTVLTGVKYPRNLLTVERVPSTDIDLCVHAMAEHPLFIVLTMETAATAYTMTFEYLQVLYDEEEM